MNSQQLILERIAAAVGEKRSDVVFVQDPVYNNTGVLRTLDAATLNQIAEVSYNFQQGYCHFGAVTNYIAAHWYGQSDLKGTSPWVKGSISDLVATVAAHLVPETGATA